MVRKLSKANAALIIFTAILLFSVFAQIQYQTHMWSNFKNYYFIEANKLSEKPIEYFTLKDPDQYVLRAINGEQYVNVPYEDTEINELTNQYETNNVEYNGSYYTIWIGHVDAFPKPTLPYIVAGFAISILGIVIIAVFKVTKKYKLPTK